MAILCPCFCFFLSLVLQWPWALDVVVCWCDECKDVARLSFFCQFRFLFFFCFYSYLIFLFFYFCISSDFLFRVFLSFIVTWFHFYSIFVFPVNFYLSSFYRILLFDSTVFYKYCLSFHSHCVSSVFSFRFRWENSKKKKKNQERNVIQLYKTKLGITLITYSCIST